MTLSGAQMPVHQHAAFATPEPPGPGDQLPTYDTNAYGSNSTSNLVQMNAAMIGPAGGGRPHNNVAPITVMLFCIALTGNYPERQ